MMSNNDEKILKALEDLQADVRGLKSDVTTIKDVQHEQGKHLETVELKVEAVHAYQKQAHDEIMGHLIDTTEITARDQKILEKRIDRIEKHLGLPPLK